MAEWRIPAKFIFGDVLWEA